MKKKQLLQSLNKYFSAEEKSMKVPPLEKLKAYGEFDEVCEPPVPERRSPWGIRRAGLIAACLALLIAVAVALPAFVGRPGPAESGTPEGNGGVPNGQPTNSLHPSVSDEQGEPLEDTPSAPGASSEYEFEFSNSGVHEGDGMGGGWDEFEAYFPYELYDLYHLSYIVTWEEIYAAESKLLAENEYFQTDQLPSLYLAIRELNISKEEFVRVNEKIKKTNEELHTEQDVYTDEQIDWLFSDADVQTIQAAFKLDTALLYNGRLYNPYELLALKDPLLRELADTEEMTAYLANLNDYWFADVLKHRLEGSS